MKPLSRSIWGVWMDLRFSMSARCPWISWTELIEAIQVSRIYALYDIPQLAKQVVVDDEPLWGPMQWPQAVYSLAPPQITRHSHKDFSGCKRCSHLDRDAFEGPLFLATSHGHYNGHASPCIFPSRVLDVWSVGRRCSRLVTSLLKAACSATGSLPPTHDPKKRPAQPNARRVGAGIDAPSPPCFASKVRNPAPCTGERSAAGAVPWRLLQGVPRLHGAPTSVAKIRTIQRTILPWDGSNYRRGTPGSERLSLSLAKRPSEGRSLRLHTTSWPFLASHKLRPPKMRSQD